MTDPQPKEIRVHLFGRTDVGQIREHNEDNFLVADLTRKTRSLMDGDRRQIVGPRGTLLGVCDGMGGAAAGEVASQLAVDIIFEKLTEGVPAHHDDLARQLVQAVEEAGSRIYREAKADRSRHGMGTTATAAALLDRRLFVAQVGDSRAYILRQGVLKQVSRDQSLVTQLIEAGQLTEEEAENFEHNNIILQALGTAETVQVDLTYVDLCQGDVLLLCSDGLSGMIKNQEIRETLLENQDPFEACRVLVERANAAGGHDNITVIVARFDGEGLPPAGADEPEVGYRKYALPESAAAADATVRLSLRAPDLATAQEPPADRRESRRLKVGVTMVGMSSLAGLDLGAGGGEARGGARTSAPPPVFDASGDPIELPTTGLPPRVVGLLVLGGLVVAAVAGFFLLR